MPTIHSEHFDYICGLGIDQDLTNHLNTLQYASIDTAALLIPNDIETIAAWATFNSKIDSENNNEFFPPSVAPGRVLLVHLNGGGFKSEVQHPSFNG